MDIQIGDLVLLTQAYEEYMYDRNPGLKVSLVNRIAKLEDIIDWDTPRGRMLKEARLKSGKWKGLPLEDNRYIFSIYYHDLTGRNGKRGVVERGVPMFSCHPKTGAPFFEKMPSWLYREILKPCERFELEEKNEDVS